MSYIKHLFKAAGLTTSNNITNNNTHSKSSNNEIIIHGTSDVKGDFTSNVEAEGAIVSEILDYIGESNISINQMYKLGKSKPSERRPRSTLL